MREAKITKKTVKGTTIRLSGPYVTNGHWLMERVALGAKQQLQFASLETMAAAGFADVDCPGMHEIGTDAMARVLDIIGSGLWTVTPFAVVTNKTDAMRVVSPDTGNGPSMLVKEKYLELLGLETYDGLKGSASGALRSIGDGPARVIMPVRPPKGMTEIPAANLA